MKTRNYLLLFVPLFMLAACKKAPVTKEVKFTSTTYKTLSGYDPSTGTPDVLLQDTISQALMTFVDTTLPDRQNLVKRRPDLFSNPTANSDINVTAKSQVFVTFVSTNSLNSNALAFYTYPTNQPPASAQDVKTITYVFPNAGHLTGLKSGDKVSLGTFDVGTSIGFVLMQNAWDTTNHTLNNDAVHFCTDDILNPEVDPNLKKHAVLINYPAENKVLISFEDTNRTDPACDNDFNDVIFYVTLQPE